MAKTLFRFVKQVVSLAQKHSAAGLIQISNPRGFGYPGWKHVVLHYLRIELDATYLEVIDWVSEMDRIRGLLNLPIDGFPDPSTLCRSFDRAPMWVWRTLLNRSAALLDWSGHAAIDSTFFTRRRASPHYLGRIDRSVETLKATFLVDTADQAIIDVACSAKWPNDATVGPKLATRNVDDLVSLAADKGYDSKAFRDQLRDEGIRPLIKHRLFQPIDHAHNARLDDDRYNQRALAESVNSSIKRSIRETIDSQAWYREFREIVLVASVYNLRRAIKVESRRPRGVQ